jgi:hypothetical protein
MHHIGAATMGVNANILLPENVRVRDVACVIGVAAGLKSVRSLIDGGFYLCVPGAKVTSTSVVSMAQIMLVSDDGTTLIDGEEVHFCFYHFETDEQTGRAINPTSTPFWLAIGIKLVDFFGGHLIAQDCEESAYNYKRPPVYEKMPDDGQPYFDFQMAMEAVVPITQKDLDEVRSFAAYSDK